MIQIRPVSDLRNKYPEIENIVANGNPVYLTKNGYGTMVVLSLEAYESLTENLEMHLDRADKAELLISEVQKAIYDRLEMPEAFEKVRSGKQRQYPYYRIYVKNYTILYVVIGNIMEVRHMFYSRRDIQNLI